MSLNNTIEKGIIVMHSSKNPVPENWKICDGKEGLPNFTNQFPKGASTENKSLKCTSKTADDYKETLLSEYDIPEHHHKLDIKADHFHKSWYWGGSGSHPARWVGFDKEYSNSYDYYPVDRKGILPMDMRPPFFEISYIINKDVDNFTLLPGMIIMLAPNYSIPDGWVLCNGQKGTPNTTNRFPKGQGNKGEKEELGGSEHIFMKEENIPNHRHVVKSGIKSKTSKTWDFNDYKSGRRPCLFNGYSRGERGYGAGDEVSSSGIVNGVDNTEPISLMPLFQKVKFIRLESGHRIKRKGIDAIPSGAILMSTSLKSIDGLVLCDGKMKLPNGRGKVPNLVNRFPLGEGDSLSEPQEGGNEKIKIELKHLPDHNHDYELFVSKFSNTWGMDAIDMPDEWPAIYKEHIRDTEKNVVDPSKKLEQFEDFPGFNEVYFLMKP